MPAAKPLSRDQIIMANKATLSCRAASRYLNVSYPQYKRYAKIYFDEETGKSLFELQKNRQGKGIPKFLKHTRKKYPLQDILDGKISAVHFKPEKLKYRLIEEGYLEEKCQSCGFEERRVLDYKIPLLVNFRDNNKNNWVIENIELLCYNCYFLQVGDIFNVKDIQKIEDSSNVFKSTNMSDWEVDNYHLKKLEEMGINVDKDNISEYLSKE